MENGGCHLWRLFLSVCVDWLTSDEIDYEWSWLTWVLRRQPLLFFHFWGCFGNFSPSWQPFTSCCTQITYLQALINSRLSPKPSSSSPSRLGENRKNVHIWILLPVEMSYVIGIQCVCLADKIDLQNTSCQLIRMFEHILYLDFLKQQKM